MHVDDFQPPIGLLMVPASERGMRTLEGVLDAATEVFGADGDRRRPSVAAVAEIVGISSAAVYQYFPDRMALVLAAMERDCARLVSEALDLSLVRGEGTFAVAFLEASAESAGKHPLAVRAAFTERRDVLAWPLVRREFDRVAQSLAVELAAAQRAGLVRDDIPAPDLADLIVTSAGHGLWAEAIGLGPDSPRYQSLVALFRAVLLYPLPDFGDPERAQAFHERYLAAVRS